MAADRVAVGMPLSGRPPPQTRTNIAGVEPELGGELQAGWWLNYVSGDAKDIQLSGLFNYTKDTFTGLQGAVLFSSAKSVNGIQITLLVNPSV